MSNPGSMTRWAEALRSPDRLARDEAARRIWERYSSRLMAVVRRNLDEKIQRRADAEDVLQSMYTSFCGLRLRDERSLPCRDDLWRLLLHITLCKVANTARHHQAACRDLRRELAAPGNGETPEWLLSWMDQHEPSPLDALVFQEEFDGWLNPLSDDLRRIALWKFEGYTNKEIGVKINRTEKTVELKMGIIRKRLEERARVGEEAEPR